MTLKKYVRPAEHPTTPPKPPRNPRAHPPRRRATIRIDADAGLPTRGAIQANAEGLAQYAAISQAAGLTPIVEPELLIEGTHSPELFAEVNTILLAPRKEGEREGGSR